MSSIDFSTLTQKIAALLAAHPEQPVLIALDGRCGSGKTTLAGQLAEQFPASIVFHTDDYYLPPAQRIPEWEKTPCANMDLARLREELLRPARAGEPVFYRAYSCREGAYRPGQCIPAQPLSIVEGSYSHHPLLAGCYDLKVFVTCSRARRTGAPAGRGVFQGIQHRGKSGSCARYDRALLSFCKFVSCSPATRVNLWYS